MKSFCYLVVGIIFLSSCASRGFKLSQQMPGLDNNLKPIQGVAGSPLKYKVAADGQILVDEGRDKQHKDVAKNNNQSRRDISSERKNFNLLIQEDRPFVESTLDPNNGAILLN